MTNGINKLFIENVKVQQKDIIISFLDMKGWKLISKPETIYGEHKNTEWQHFYFNKRNNDMTMNIGIDDYKGDKPVYFYEVILYDDKGNEIEKSCDKFDDLNDYEYYFNNTLKAVVKFSKLVK